MLSEKELVFAQNYPFSSTAALVVKESNFSLEDIKENVFARATEMIKAAVQGKPYFIKETTHKEILQNEVLAFPVAKIILSLVNNQDYFERFASMVSNSTLNHLKKEKKDATEQLAVELKINYLFDDKRCFVELPLKDFLDAEQKPDFMKLVNQKIEKGKVCLSFNQFNRVIAEKVKEKVASSLPVETQNVPRSFKDSAKKLVQELSSKKFTPIDFKPIGKIRPESFPECMKKLYSDLLAGKNLAHFARFDLTCFLVAVGMPSEQIINLFKKTPNYKEKLSRYHIERISGKKGTKYAPASCAKIKTHGMCPEDCGAKHPITFYRRKLFPKKPSRKE